MRQTGPESRNFIEYQENEAPRTEGLPESTPYDGGMNGEEQAEWESKENRKARYFASQASSINSIIKESEEQDPSSICKYTNPKTGEVLTYTGAEYVTFLKERKMGKHSLDLADYLRQQNKWKEKQVSQESVGEESDTGPIEESESQEA